MIIAYNDHTNTLQAQNIIQKRRRINFGGINSLAFSLLYNEKLNTLLVGYENGKVIQYTEDARGNWKVQKDYGNIGIGAIYSNEMVGHIAAFGGNRFQSKKRRHNLRLINMKDKIFIVKPLKTDVKLIKSISFITMSKSKIILVLRDRKARISYSKKQLYDATNLCKNQKIIFDF